MEKILFAMLIAFAASAYATQPGNNGGGNGGCGVGQQTNGCGSTGGAGGSGGAGGQGGTGVGVGVGVGIAAAQANAAALAQQQQGQQQGQGQSQSSRNNNQSSATGGNATGGAASASATGGASGGNTMTVQGDTLYAPAQERNPVSTAYAAPLTASNGTCMGSSSAGAQGAAVGVSFGTTWTDGSCDIRYDAEALRAAGLPMAARARLCQKPEIAKAMEDAGTPCPKARAAAAEVRPVVQRNPMPWQAGG